MIANPYRPRDILAAVCSGARIDFGDLIGPARTERVVRAREAAVFLLRKRTHLSYPDIAELFGRKRVSHCTFIDMHKRTLAGGQEERDGIIFRAEVALEAQGATK